MLSNADLEHLLESDGAIGLEVRWDTAASERLRRGGEPNTEKAPGSKQEAASKDEDADAEESRSGLAAFVLNFFPLQQTIA